MAVRKIREYGDEILLKKSKQVEKIDERIQILIDDMFDTMHNQSNGVGLSAVQVGVLKQVITIDIEEDHSKPMVLINPKILKEKGVQEVEEGCLSLPNQFAKVIRPAEITIEAQDREGKIQKIKAKDLLAQAISHEIDHLNGTLFISKIIPGTLEYITGEE